MDCLDKIENSEVLELKKSLEFFEKLIDDLKKDLEVSVLKHGDNNLITNVIRERIDDLWCKINESKEIIRVGFENIHKINEIDNNPELPKSSLDLINLTKKVYEKTLEVMKSKKIENKIQIDKNLSMEKVYKTPKDLIHEFRHLIFKYKIDLKDFLSYYSKTKEMKAYLNLKFIRCEWHDVDLDRKKKLEFFFKCIVDNDKFDSYLKYFKSHGKSKLKDIDTKIFIKKSPEVKKTSILKRKRFEPTEYEDDNSSDIMTDDEIIVKNKKKYIYDISDLNIEDKISPNEIMIKLKNELQEEKITTYCFCSYILCSSSHLIRRLLKVSKNSWNDLNEQEVMHFKIIYKWLNDEDRINKIILKDPNIIERKNSSLKKSSVTLNDTLNCHKFLKVDISDIENKTNPKQLAIKLKSELNNNNVDRYSFLTKVLNKKDLRTLENILAESRSWKTLPYLTKINFRKIYDWLNDEKRFEKVDILVKRDVQQLMVNNGENEKSIVDNDNTTFDVDVDVDSIKIEYDDNF